MVVIADAPPPLAVPGQPIAIDVHAVSDLREALGPVRVTATARWAEDQDQATPWTTRVVWEGDLAADTCARIGQFSFETPTGHGPLVVDLELVSDRLIVTNRYRTVVIPSSEAVERHRLRRT